MADSEVSAPYERKHAVTKGLSRANGAIAMDIKPLHPLFAAEVIGLDLNAAPDDAAFSKIHSAFETYAVLIFRDQRISDAQQIEFSERFGELETTKVGTPGAGSKLITITNVGPNGEIMPPTDKQILSSKANRQWHADSSFKKIAAYASMLSAREIPSCGGNTEYLSMRAVYRDLPDDLKEQADQAIAIHDFSYGRSKIDPKIVTDAERQAVPPVRQAMVIDHGGHGKSLYLGAHAASVEGYSETEGRILIDRLMEFATQPKYIYSHTWQPHDLILWHNRAVLQSYPQMLVMRDFRRRFGFHL